MVTSFTTYHHCMVLLQVAPVSIPSQKFVRSPCWFFSDFSPQQHNKFHLNPSSGSLDFNHTDRHTTNFCALISHTSYGEFRFRRLFNHSFVRDIDGRSAERNRTSSNACLLIRLQKYFGNLRTADRWRSLFIYVGPQILIGILAHV